MTIASPALISARAAFDRAGDAIIQFRLANMRRKIPAHLTEALDAARHMIALAYGIA